MFLDIVAAADAVEFERVFFFHISIILALFFLCLFISSHHLLFLH